MHFLNEDHFLGRALSRFLDLIFLNLLWLLCSIPIVTAGAATAAMYDLMLRIHQREGVYLFRDFFRSFARHFKKATLLHLLTIGAGVFLAVDLWCALRMPAPLNIVGRIVVLSVCYFYLAVATHVLPVLVFYGLPIRETVRLAFRLSMKNGIFTVYIMLLNLSPVLLFLVSPLIFFKSIVFWLAVGFALIAWLASLHLIRLFAPEKMKQIYEEEDAADRS